MRRLFLALPLLLAFGGHAPKLWLRQLTPCAPTGSGTCRFIGSWAYGGNWNPATDSIRVQWKQKSPSTTTVRSVYTRGTADTINMVQTQSVKSGYMVTTVLRKGTTAIWSDSVAYTLDALVPPPDPLTDVKITPTSFQTLRPGQRTIWCGSLIYRDGRRELLPMSDSIPFVRTPLPPSRG